MTNVIDFLKASADFIATDRPDVYDSPEDALAELTEMMNSMRDENNRITLFTSFVLFWMPDSDGDEWLLARKIAGVITDEPTHSAYAYGYTKGSGTLKYGVESLPDVLDDDFDF